MSQMQQSEEDMTIQMIARNHPIDDNHHDYAVWLDREYPVHYRFGNYAIVANIREVFMFNTESPNRYFSAIHNPHLTIREAIASSQEAENLANLLITQYNGRLHNTYIIFPPYTVSRNTVINCEYICKAYDGYSSSEHHFETVEQVISTVFQS